MILSTWVQTASSGEAEDAVKQQFIRVNVWGKGKNFLSSAKQMLLCTRMLCRKYLPSTLYSFRNSVSYVMLICDQISVDGWNLIVTTYNIIVQHCWIRTTFPSRFKLNYHNLEGTCYSNGHPTVHICTSIMDRYMNVNNYVSLHYEWSIDFKFHCFYSDAT